MASIIRALREGFDLHVLIVRRKGLILCKSAEEKFGARSAGGRPGWLLPVDREDARESGVGLYLPTLRDETAERWCTRRNSRNIPGYIGVLWVQICGASVAVRCITEIAADG